MIELLLRFKPLVAVHPCMVAYCRQTRPSLIGVGSEEEETGREAERGRKREEMDVYDERDGTKG